jgi:hypothetical protein
MVLGARSNQVLNGTETSHSGLNVLVSKLKTLTGLTLKQRDNPLVEHLIAARMYYAMGNFPDARRRAAYAKFAIEDLERIKDHDRDLLQQFKRKLRQASLQNYFGLRLEIRIAAKLITDKIPFKKSEAPDFKLEDVTRWPGVGIECTSAHLDLECTKRPVDVLYKVIRAIESKTEDRYATPLTIVAVDTSNLLFHEGHEECSKILADKDMSKAHLQGPVDASVFQSALYYTYASESLKDGARTDYLRVRIDRKGIDARCKDFLDLEWPFGDWWGVRELRPTV